PPASPSGRCASAGARGRGRRRRTTTGTGRETPARAGRPRPRRRPSGATVRRASGRATSWTPPYPVLPPVCVRGPAGTGHAGSVDHIGRPSLRRTPPLLPDDHLAQPPALVRAQHREGAPPAAHELRRRGHAVVPAGHHRVHIVGLHLCR